MSEITTTMTEPMTVAFLATGGPYAQIPMSFGVLYQWVAANGLQPVGMPAAVYLTIPSEVPEEDARWELWAPVEGEPSEREANAEGLGVKRIPGMLVAAAMHRGPYETLGETYRALWEYIGAQGYAPAGPPVERYYSDPDTTPPQEYLTEVWIPVQQS